jgi:hypothetical protein
MDMKHLYKITSQSNILEKYKLPYTFFTDPQKELDEETCLHEIICILTNDKLHFSNDSSDFGEFIDNKSAESIEYDLDINSNHVKAPYVLDQSNPLIMFYESVCESYLFT